MKYIGEKTVVFDIGGTWFRSGIYTEAGKLAYLSRQPAINYKNTKFNTISELQSKLIIYIAREITRLRKRLPKDNVCNVAISMGAALNAHTGYILNSGPLWGPKCLPVNLYRMLIQAIPDAKIFLINDVSAALLREVTESKSKTCSKMMLITISSGIACRVFNFENDTIPVDKIHGIQGEIGHLPIRFTVNNKPLVLKCDCGGTNHLNAFCSGRGIENVLQTLKQKLSFDEFSAALQKGDKFALNILDAITKPLAELLLVTFIIDPLVERVVLTGGVINSLGKYYLKSILHQLKKRGMYQVTKSDPNFFKKRLSLGKNDDKSGLIGAGISITYDKAKH